MVPLHLSHTRRRRGVVLLVVITLLTLFAVVGIAFVLFAQSEATASRVWRESETLQRPDMDPEMLLAYTLSQLLYGTNNQGSQLIYQSLAENMYGPPGNTMPFNGTGRIHTGGAADTYYQLDYSNTGVNPFKSYSPNVPYTYPDFNNAYLAAVRPSDGAVLIPSFYRTTPQGQVVSLRAKGLPPPEDGFCDVKSLPDSPGLFNPTTGKFTPNDSVWTDIGFPVMKAPDGRQFKPLVAMLMQDLDNRVNVNTHGNVLSDIGHWQTWCISHTGWSPGEVSLDWVIGAPGPEVQYVFVGNNGVTGRYDRNIWGNPTLDDKFCPGGIFYSSTDIDCWPNNQRDALQLPGTESAPGTNAFPYYKDAYSGSWWLGYDRGYSPNSWNYYDPTQDWFNNGSMQRQPLSRRFKVGDIEALLRYGDRGSPALRSDLYMLCPQSFQNPKTRRQVTTLSMDLARPGVTAAMYNPNPGQASQYQLPAPAAGQPPQYPKTPPLPFPPAGASPNNGEFGPNWYAMANAAQGVLLRNRINLNRGFTDYSAVTNASPSWANNDPNIGPAMQSRQQLAQEIFTVLCTVTGAANINDPTVTPGAPTFNQAAFDALRWLAQLAVNIVDFTSFPGVNHTNPAPVDVMTMFNWNPTLQQTMQQSKAQPSSIIQQCWVFGTVLPRLVVNEAYIELDNTQADVMNKNQMPTSYDINCWVELYNPFPAQTNTGGRMCVPVSYVPAAPSPANNGSGSARLYCNGTTPYAAYRFIIAQADNGMGGNTNASAMTQNNNVLGVPLNIQTVVDNYTADTPTSMQKVYYQDANSAAALAAQGYSATAYPPSPNVAYEVQPVQGTSGPVGSNQGFYVLGPKVPFPGTSSLPDFFATLPVKEQQSTAGQQNDPTLNLTNAANVNSSMHYTYTPPNGQNVTMPNHTLVLQRLACPYMPPQPDPTQPLFNPYVTVDYMLKVPTNDGRTLNVAQQPVLTNYNSVGRNQPYAADNAQQVPQMTPPPMMQASPKNTFFGVNDQTGKNQTTAFPYNWMFFANRWLVSPGELVHVSGYKPHQLTQMYVQGAQQTASTTPGCNQFARRAPWFDSSACIYRAMEFFEGGMRPQWSPIGGRFAGRININTIWDLPTAPDTMMALCDPEPSNFFGPCVAPGSYSQSVLSLYQKMLQSRTPNGVPGPTDRPFRGLATAYAPAGDQQYGANGSSVDDTILRVDPTMPAIVNPATNQPKRLFETNPDQTLPKPEMYPVLGTANQPVTNTYATFELLTKIWNSTTTRSNVFGVWITVGFFEVTNAGTTPPTLGAEIGRSENRQVRHRMFAVLDRTNLAMALNGAAGQPGPRPFFVDSWTAVTQPGQTAISVPCSLGSANYYEEMTWGIAAGNQLLVDPGPNQEIVTVASVAAGGVNGSLKVTATFANPHPAGFAITNALPGNPGPQPSFDPRNPAYTGVVRYFSIIE